jgi:TorA maturation chaperone TorD
LATKTWNSRYGDVRRVIGEELSYIYRYWMQQERSSASTILRRASDHLTGVIDTATYLHSANVPNGLRVSLAWEVDTITIVTVTSVLNFLLLD